MAKTTYQRLVESRERQAVSNHANMIANVFMSGFSAIDNYIVLKRLDRDRVLIRESDIQKLESKVSKEIAEATVKEVYKIHNQFK